MVRPCGARGFVDPGDAVLHYCIRPLIGASAPDHHGYQRACDLILGLYGPAVRCKRFRRSWRCGLALLYPASDWSVCSGPSWISARMRSDSRTSLERASWVTSARTRREDRSLHLVYPLAGLG